MKKRLSIIAIVAVAVVLVFIGCQPEEEAGTTEQPQEEAGPIKIGVAGAHSGDLASYGLPTVNAAELVVAQANADGGILGRQIELVVEDDQCQPEVATNTASKLVGEEVAAVIGHICSGATRAALGIYTGENIITISPSATNPGLTQSGEYPTFFRTIAPDDAQGEMQAQFVAEELGAEIPRRPSWSARCAPRE
jgi:branched-chain amino acid transport system substrate-binding protein